MKEEDLIRIQSTWFNIQGLPLEGPQAQEHFEARQDIYEHLLEELFKGHAYREAAELIGKTLEIHHDFLMPLLFSKLAGRRKFVLGRELLSQFPSSIHLRVTGYLTLAERSQAKKDFQAARDLVDAFYAKRSTLTADEHNEFVATHYAAIYEVSRDPADLRRARVHARETRHPLLRAQAFRHVASRSGLLEDYFETFRAIRRIADTDAQDLQVEFTSSVVCLAYGLPNGSTANLSSADLQQLLGHEDVAPWKKLIQTRVRAMPVSVADPTLGTMPDMEQASKKRPTFSDISASFDHGREPSIRRGRARTRRP
jgi:hypothetical protein